MNGRTQERGFTILELMIATAVFSIILLVATIGLIQIGRLYNRGVTNSRTQETTRSIVEEVSQNIQFSGGTIFPLTPNGASTGYCIGQRRYSVLIGQQLPDDPNRHGLVVDSLVGTCGSGIQAVDLTQATLTDPSTGGPLINPRELLLPAMRVSNLAISPVAPPVNSNLYRVTVRVAYGADDVLNNPASNDPTCQGGVGQQFCSVAELSTIVQKRVQ